MCAFCTELHKHMYINTYNHTLMQSPMGNHVMTWRTGLTY